MEKGGKGSHLTPCLRYSLSSWSPVCVTTSATTSNALSAQAVTRTTRNPSLCPNMGTWEEGERERERGRDTIAYATTAC